MEITIIINRADTMDWLGGDKELAEKFAARIAALTGYNVELGEPREMSTHEIITEERLSSEQKREIEDTYGAACDNATSDWYWAE